MGCLVVGLTGQTGSGKSTVSRILTDCGIPVIDCDRLAREAVEPGSECLLQLVQAFGAKILQQDGSLDRAKMAAIAFPDPEKLEMLNSITHKAILRLLEKRLEMLVSAGETLVVVDAPTLFESGADEFCSIVISVIAPESLRYERILERDHLEPESAKRRMGAQKDDNFYTGRSDYVLVNDGSVKVLEERTRQLVRILQKKAGV